MNLQELLNNWNIKCDINTLLSMWNESHRHYHNLNHLNDLIQQINENKSKYSEKQYDKLIITSLFHDCIYEPSKDDNEEKSAQFFEDCCLDKSNLDIKEIKQAILDTKRHHSTTKLSESFNKLDMSIVEKNFDELLEWENGISEEYKFAGKNYKPSRIKFLESVLDKYPHNTENLIKLIDWIRVNY